MPDAAFSVANAQGYLLTVFLQEVGRKIATAPSGDAPDLDLETLWTDILTSNFTEQDEAFRKEWQGIQDDRVRAGWQENVDEAQDLAYRVKELRAMVRSACRKGILTRYDSPIVEEWKPKVKKVKQVGAAN